MPTWYLPLTATLTQPMIITVPGGDPNSASTSLAIPGSAVRGSVARAVEHDPELLDRLVLNDTVRYLWLTPVIGKMASRVRPRSWRSVDAGERGSTCVDLAGLAPENWPKKAKADLPQFVARSGSTWFGRSPATGARFHNARDADKGAAWKDKTTDETVGAFFAYESIAAGEKFAGAIAITAPTRDDASSIQADLRAALGEQGWFGRSRRRGYGGACRLEYDALTELPPGSPSTSVTMGQRICVTAASPYVGRDQTTGQIDPNAFVAEVIAALGQEATPVATFLALTRAGGYNRAWGSDLPDTPALGPGSTIVMDLSSPPTTSMLDRLLHDGIGERRGDGFGRVDITAPLKVGFEISDPKPRTAKPTDPPNDTTLAALERIALKRLRMVRAASAAKTASDAVGVPSSSLLGRLRTQLRSEAPLASLRDLVNDENLRPPAERALHSCRIEGLNAHSWLRDGAVDPGDRADALRATVERELAETGGRPLIEQFPTLVSRIVAEHGETLETERIDRVLAVMQRRAREANR